MRFSIKAPDTRLTFGLAFVGGYADAAGFVLAKTFTGHVTGNLVLAAVSAAARDWRTTLVRCSSVLAFLAGVVLSVALARILPPQRPSSHLSAALTMELMLVISAYLALTALTGRGMELFVLFLSLALGVQNGAFLRTGGINVHTTYLTGMITSLLVTKAEEFHSVTLRAAPALHNPKARFLGTIWIIFFCGALTGAAMVYRFHAAGLFGLLPLLLTVLLADALAVRSAQPHG